RARSRRLGAKGGAFRTGVADVAARARDDPTGGFALHERVCRSVKSRSTGSRGLIMAKRDDEKLIVGLDIGTSKVLAIVGEISANGEIEIIGVGHHPSRGMKKG